MFSDVDAYVDFVVRCVKRHEGECDGQRLEAIAQSCAVSYGRVCDAWRDAVGTQGCGSFGGVRVARGLAAAGGEDAGGFVLGDKSVVDGGCGEFSGGSGSGADCSHGAGLVDGNEECGEGSLSRNGDCSGSFRGRGKNWASNRAKKEKKRKKSAMQRDWRGTRGTDGSGGCLSDESVAGTACTVDTRTAVEIEAAQTLAARRVVENKVATELAKHKLRALADKSRTEAVDRLAAARYEKQINQAKAASQKSFKQCDESLKSLGSTGSAGEFALKQEVKKAKEREQVYEYVQQQLDCALKYVSREGMQAVAALPPPVFQSEYDAFGDCPSDYDEDQAESYYEELNRRQREIDDQTALCG